MVFVETGLEQPVMVAGTFGGLFVVSGTTIRDMPMRDEWENDCQPCPSNPDAVIR